MIPRFFLLIFLCVPIYSVGQDITLFQQFNGRFDYTAIGNTLNQFENNRDRSFCEILESSQDSLILPTGSSIKAAFLYWAGSGVGDTNISLNQVSVDAEQTYSVNFTDPSFGELLYFSCFTDITNLVIAQGETTYQFSDLDISEALSNNPGYCQNRTNFAGWSMYVIYEQESLPLNQISLFQGLEIINRNNQEKTIILDNLNVIDNNGAKIGFLAWEGDDDLNYGETLSINNTILSNLPLNPPNNAFNGTNSFNNSNAFYNGDLDVYTIQDNIRIGDTSASIRLTTGALVDGEIRADLIIINNIITVLNSQLPDATTTIDQFFVACERDIQVDYTVYNLNATDILPADTPISFYADDQLIGLSTTLNLIEIGGFENYTINLTIPFNINNEFELLVVVDDVGTRNGIVTETNETNNTYSQHIILTPIPVTKIVEVAVTCNEGLNSASFNLIELFDDFVDNSSVATFYITREDLETQQNEISDPESYTNTSIPETIFVRVAASPCDEFYEFTISIVNCPPIVPEGFSPNNDGINDWFNIQGLYDIFVEHNLLIYNRYGVLIFEGNNSIPWNGKANRGIYNQGKILPVGTYYYILNLNDPNFEVLSGWVYMNY